MKKTAEEKGEEEPKSLPHPFDASRHRCLFVHTLSFLLCVYVLVRFFSFPYFVVASLFYYFHIRVSFLGYQFSLHMQLTSDFVAKMKNNSRFV